MLLFRYLIFFSQIFFFSKYSIRNIIRVSITLDPLQVRHLVRPDLDPNNLQSLSADDKMPFTVIELSKACCLFSAGLNYNVSHMLIESEEI